MRRISKTGALAAAVLAVAIVGAGVGPAAADPPAGTVPALTAIVGVGAQTTQGVMDAIATAYDATNPTDDLYSWDAVDPATGAPGPGIVTKGSSPADMTCATARPDGSGPGITALQTATVDDGHPCIDYARSITTAPAPLASVPFAEDAVSWVTTTKATGAPATLTAAQLSGIYSCKDRTWASVGGTSTADIVPALPQGDSSIFLAAIGNPAPGSCLVNREIDIPGDPMNPVPLEENTTVSVKNASGEYYTGNAYFFAHNPNALFPYSVADWIAQQPAPDGGGHATSTFASSGVTKPRAISGVSPVTDGSPDTISTTFTRAAATKDFTSMVYNVVRALAPGPLTTIFGIGGVICSDPAIIKSWGFLTIGAQCG
jgi:hypothetical protein